MANLYAPWRMEYVGGEKEPGCLFCRVRDAGTGADRQNLVVWRGEHALVMLNKFPYTAGHMLVAPRAHASTLEDLDDVAGLGLHDAVRRSLRALRTTMNPDGFNVGANLGRVAGAGIPDHAHMHVLPRWNGDTSFMPVLAEVTVVNEHLERTWEKLTAAFSA